jgi:aspartyl-tRNA(Asn)/glutamyl-tRNA(Gln) amidotransferase subunit B
LRTLGAGAANLEKGEMRIEANISVRKQETGNSGKMGTKVEVKNINSFRSVERAIAYEIKRQTELLEKGEKVVQSTRGWDESKQETFHQRLKEGSADYRYFPEPDLPKLSISEIPEFSRESIKATLPELPWERRERYARVYGLKDADVQYLGGSSERSTFFDAVTKALMHDTKLAALATNYIVSDLAGIYAKKETGDDSLTLDPLAFAKLMRMVADQTLSSRGAKEVLLLMVEKGGDPETLANEYGFIQIHDATALTGAVETVLAQEEKAVAEYRSGKQAALQYLLGKSMKESKGAGNPEELKKLLVEKLK